GTCADVPRPCRVLRGRLYGRVPPFGRGISHDSARPVRRKRVRVLRGAHEDGPPPGNRGRHPGESSRGEDRLEFVRTSDPPMYGNQDFPAETGRGKGAGRLYGA